MFNIIICEDEEIIRKNIATELKSISLKHDLPLQIVLATGNPNAVLECISKKQCDILLLDIDLQNSNMDGIQLAENLRKLNSNIYIIFLSSRLERIFEVFKVRPYDFIPKPSIMPHLEETILNIASSNICGAPGHFTNIKNKIINLSDIMYIEKQVMKSIFHSKIHNVEIYVSFLELLSCLTENFIQVSKSFIVNKDFITYADKKEKYLYMNDGTTIKYSSKFMPNTEVLFNE